MLLFCYVLLCYFVVVPSLTEPCSFYSFFGSSRISHAFAIRWVILCTCDQNTDTVRKWSSTVEYNDGCNCKGTYVRLLRDSLPWNQDQDTQDHIELHCNNFPFYLQWKPGGFPLKEGDMLYAIGLWVLLAVINYI